jgi:hypothetical protein
MHTVKGSTDGIRRSLEERLLGDASNVRACRSRNGPFEPLRTYPEFRDLVIELLSRQQRQQWYLQYNDANDASYTISGTIESLQRALKEGLLNDARGLQAALSKDGPFKPLEEIPEFSESLSPLSSAQQAPLPSGSVSPPIHIPDDEPILHSGTNITSERWLGVLRNIVFMLITAGMVILVWYLGFLKL